MKVAKKTGPVDSPAAPKRSSAKKASQAKKAARTTATILAAPSKKAELVGNNLDLDAAIKQINSLKKQQAEFLSVVSETEFAQGPENLGQSSISDYQPNNQAQFKQQLRHEFIAILQSIYQEQRASKPWQTLFKPADLLMLKVKIGAKPEPVAFLPIAALFDIHYLKNAKQIILVLKAPKRAS